MKKCEFKYCETQIKQNTIWHRFCCKDHKIRQWHLDKAEKINREALKEANKAVKK